MPRLPRGSRSSLEGCCCKGFGIPGHRRQNGEGEWVNDLMEQLLHLADEVRYVAVYQHGGLSSAVRAGLSGASSSESDRFEELIVNPTLLRLVTQRGNIDCGGVEYIVIRYGNFFQLVHPIVGGHVSVALEATADPLRVVPELRRILNAGGIAFAGGEGRPPRPLCSADSEIPSNTL